jgi:acyl-CoA thioester hydrolase
MEISDNIKFRHIMPMQIRWNDTDMFGHVNNSVYFQFYDTAKTQYIADVCPNVDWHKFAIVMVHVECDFVAPIMAEDQVAVRTSIIRTGRTSMTMLQEAYDTTTDELRCRCLSVMVFFDQEQRCSTPLPQSWVNAINKYEGR